MWTVRSLPEGRLFRNGALRRFLMVEEPVIEWRDAIKWAPAGEGKKVEDGHSHAIKTGITQVVDMQMKSAHNNHELVALRNVVSPYRCDRCVLQCGLLVSLIELRCVFWPVLELWPQFQGLCWA
jgi:hypothetical protein